jgi:hypothetical protein
MQHQQQNALGLGSRCSGTSKIYGPARPGGKVLPAGLFVKYMHRSDFSSLCADHPRLFSLFDRSRDELYRSPTITAQTLSAFHGSFQAAELFPMLFLPIAYCKITIMLYACRIILPAHTLERHLARDFPWIPWAISAARHASRLASSSHDSHLTKQGISISIFGV